MTQTEVAVEFLRLASRGQIDEGYSAYIHPDFKHHSPYFKGDAAALKKAMHESYEQFPNKHYEVIHVLTEGDMTVIHGSVNINQQQMRVIHLLKFKDLKIIELWDASQMATEENLNENGLF